MHHQMELSADSLLMPTTSASLLERLKKAPADSPDWNLLHEIYIPLLKSWLLRIGLPRDRIDDVTQDVLIVLVRQLPTFERRRCGSFRAWLRQIAVHLAKNFFRKDNRAPRPMKDVLSQLEDPSSDLSREWDRDHDRHVWQKLQDVVRPDFGRRTWDAFTKVALEGMPVKEVAAKLGISENSVLLAKSRVLKRLRDESRGFLD
jgi:RNA polymerase sigma-70 factor, ECF subfamily